MKTRIKSAAVNFVLLPLVPAFVLVLAVFGLMDWVSRPRKRKGEP
jgi:hypothetical protein